MFDEFIALRRDRRRRRSDGFGRCWHLAKRGLKVLGLERFDLGHAMGSSHGLTRIIRLAYFEGSHYVPIVKRAHQLWQETGDAAG
jgi:sarcosine oxidase